MASPYRFRPELLLERELPELLDPDDRPDDEPPDEEDGREMLGVLDEERGDDADELRPEDDREVDSPLLRELPDRVAEPVMMFHRLCSRFVVVRRPVVAVRPLDEDEDLGRLKSTEGVRVEGAVLPVVLRPPTVAVRVDEFPGAEDLVVPEARVPS